MPAHNQPHQIHSLHTHMYIQKQVPRGAASPNPPRYQVGLEEVEALKERAE